MVVEVTLLAVGIGLTLLAGYLLREKQKNLTQDDKPTTLATRGSFAPVIKGRRRVGPIFAYAGQRRTTKEKSKGGKGSGTFGGKTRVWRETAMHVLCVGPVWSLHNIEQGGEVLFEGPITADSHPSGSLIDLGNEGSFRIFWGEVDQPPNTYLGSAERMGISSRWPQFCYIEWRDKRLGSSPNWPLMTYTVETRPTDSILSQTDGYIAPTLTQIPTPLPVYSHEAGVSGEGYFVVLGEWVNVLPPGTQIEVQNNTGLGSSTAFTVLRAQYELTFTATSTTPLGTEFGYYVGRTRIYLQETLTGATDDGEIYYYEAARDDGWNPAHIIAETLFGQWPIGLGLDTSEWDIDSLEDLGLLLSNEDLRCSSIAPDGQTGETTLGAWMQDFGVFLPINMRTGLIQFVPIREPEGTIVNIPDHAILDRPQVRVRLSTNEIDHIVYSFSDEENGYRDMTIGIDDDGQATFQQFFRSRTAQIINTTHFSTAARIAERRAPEDMAGGADIKIECGREARSLLPGRPVVVSGFDEVLRLVSVTPDAESGNVTLSFIPDSYGAPLSDFVIGQANTGAEMDPVESDLLNGILELPESVIGGSEPITILPLGIRAHDTIQGHYVHLSRDNTTYTYITDDETVVTGGTLLEGLDGEYELDQGPTFTALGPDIDTVEDLSSDSVSWRGGRQIAVLMKANGQSEICFLKKITNISGDTYRLDGLIRARYDTRQLEWEAGDKVFILQDDDGEPIQDALLEPVVSIFQKYEPFGLGSLSLSSVQETVADLYGKGIRPVTPSGVRLDMEQSTLWNSNSYVLTGAVPDDDLIVTWAYSTPQSPATGAGLFPAGSDVFDPAPEGDFFVEILDDMDAVIRTEQVTTNSYTYSRADRIADFGGEPTSFQVRVTQLRNGYSSDAVVSSFENET